MNQYKPLGDFTVVQSRIARELMKQVSLEEPFASHDLSVFRETVKSGRKLLPERYHDVYLNVLEQAIAQAEKSLERSGSTGQTRIMRQLELIFSTLASPIVQLQSPKLAGKLKGFHSLLSNLYRRFLDDDKIRASAKKSLKWPDIDPLGFFSQAGTSPYALPASDELPVALIAKPMNHDDFVPLWFVDGHEVGGHTIHAAIQDFEADLKTRIPQQFKEAFQQGKIVSKRAKVRVPNSNLLSTGGRYVPISVFMSGLWSTWLHEILADVAGILNLGPMYVNGMITFLSARELNRRLKTSSVYDASERFGSHPIQVVRVLTALAVLEKLDFNDRDLYVSELHKRLEKAVGGAVPETVSWVSATGKQLTQLELEDIKAVIPIVVEAVLNTRLACLHDRSLLELMTWGSKDEKTTRALAKNLLSRDKFNQPFEARHVVSASWLALEEASTAGDTSATKIAGIQIRSIQLLGTLYQDQCLLCSIPTYGTTRRKDLKLYQLAQLVKKLRTK